MRYADLHIHTFYSDSTFSPQEVVDCAHGRGLSAIAICDHDSVDGIEPCMAIGAEKGVEVVPGIEMAAEKIDLEAHLLGYYIDWKAVWFKDNLKLIQESRTKRIYAMAEKLRASGVPVYAEEIFKAAGLGTVGRLHVAQAMLKTGKVKSYREVFEKYIGFLKPCYVPYTKFTPEEAVRMIAEAGGVPVLAHPGHIKNDAFIAELAGYGLKGIEVYHTDHNKKMSDHFAGIAGELGLIMTGGSDCHGMGKGRILMGSVKVPYECVERLKDEAEKARRCKR